MYNNINIITLYLSQLNVVLNAAKYIYRSLGFYSSNRYCCGAYLWNTLSFFKELKENERQKMQIFAEAFKEVSSSTILINANISKISTEAIRLNSTTPMISFSHADSMYNSKNIDERILKSPSKREAY